jgi:hypothetical protein
MYARQRTIERENLLSSKERLKDQNHSGKHGGLVLLDQEDSWDMHPPTMFKHLLPWAMQRLENYR